MTVAPTLTPAGTTQTLDLDLGNIQTIDLGSASGDVTLTLSNGAAGHWYRVIVIQGATPRDLIWPAAVKWPGAQKLLLSQGDNEVDMVWLYFDGTDFLGDWNVDYS